MEEIKVGDYIKTVAGYIGKIISFSDGMYTVKMKDATIDLYIDDIKNHKENIIDLIEQGDYVNGREVKHIADFEGVNNPIRKLIFVDETHLIPGETAENDEIKSVVTKQQFEQMKYIVGDE